MPNRRGNFLTPGNSQLFLIGGKIYNFSSKYRHHGLGEFNEDGDWWDAAVMMQSLSIEKGL